MLQHIYSNLMQRPTRTIVSMLAISVGVLLILVSVGLTYGQLTDSAERTRSAGDFMVQPPDASLIFALNSGTLPVKIQRVVEEVEGVKAAAPVLAKFISEKFHLVFGVEKESFQRVTSLRFLDGRIFEQNDEVVIDSIFSNARGLGVGDRLELLNGEFTISGVFEQGIAARVLMPLSTLQEMNGTPSKASMFFVRADDKAEQNEVFERLNARMEHYKITKTSELQEIMAASTPVFRQFLMAMVFVSVVISFLIILLAMYSTITERTREIGILKSLGASKSYIVQLIIKESILICAAGVVVGFALTFIVIQLILVTFPTLPVHIPTLWRVAAASLAVGGGVLGALYPALKAAQLDPVRALGYE
jgi:putative ABC transport system permease protein